MRQVYSATLLIVLIIFGSQYCYCQKEKISGRWQITDFKTEDFPGGYVGEIQKNAFEQQANSKPDKKLSAADSAEVKEIIKETYNESVGIAYFEFNPDGSGIINLGTETHINGKYKIKDNENSIVFTPNKNQKYDGEFITIKGKEKLVFTYSFEKDELIMDLKEENTVFYLKKNTNN